MCLSHVKHWYHGVMKPINLLTDFQIRLKSILGEVCAKQYLNHGIGIAIQRANAVRVIGTVDIKSLKMEESYCLLNNYCYC